MPVKLAALPRRQAHRRRSSFEPPTSQATVVPDGLRWRINGDSEKGPVGRAAWRSARIEGNSERTLLDAGPYGLIELAASPDELTDWTSEPIPGPVWWDRRSFDEEWVEDAGGTPAFLPTPVANSHVSLLTDASPASTRQVGRVRSTSAHTWKAKHAASVPGAARRTRYNMNELHPRRARQRRRRLRRRLLLTVTVGIVTVMVTVIVQATIFSSFAVPSVSMQNTLRVGDRILVNQLAAGSVSRGDVIVFGDPGGWLGSVIDGSGFLVKRVIGLPGDRVSCCDSTTGQVIVNGIPVDEPYAVVPSGKQAATRSFSVTVPAGSLWVMGDNRYGSQDSSHHQGTPGKGFVPIKAVVGHAFATVWPLNRLEMINSERDAFRYVPSPGQTCPVV